jgi:hypothetical protein
VQAAECAGGQMAGAPVAAGDCEEPEAVSTVAVD